MHNSLTDKACSSLTCFAEARANKKTAFKDAHLRSAACKGSKGGEQRKSSTSGKCHPGKLVLWAGLNRLVSFRKLQIRAWESRDDPLTGTWYAEIAATYTFNVEAALSDSKSCCKKCKTFGMSQHTGSNPRLLHHEEKKTPTCCIELTCGHCSSTSYSMNNCRLTINQQRVGPSGQTQTLAADKLRCQTVLSICDNRSY